MTREQTLESQARALADQWDVHYNCDDDECGCREAVEDVSVRLALDVLYEAFYRRGREKRVLR